MNKEEKEIMLGEKKDELKEILENLDVDDACYLMMCMKATCIDMEEE